MEGKQKYIASDARTLGSATVEQPDKPLVSSIREGRRTEGQIVKVLGLNFIPLLFRIMNTCITYTQDRDFHLNIWC